MDLGRRASLSFNRMQSTSASATDDAAFAHLIAPHRAELLAHCYRMLGSAADAEDALQETLLRAWRGLAGFEGRSSLRSWLYTIATNVCLRAIERRPRRVLPVDYGPPRDPHDAPEAPVTESIWLDPYPDGGLAIEDRAASPEARYEQRESVELAFVAALQHLPARQRAVLLLRDVLGFSPAEIGAALHATPAAVYSALQRAHAAVAERLPARSQQATLREIGDERLREVVARYVRAWEERDVDAIVAMLAADATFAMPPMPEWYRGRAAIGTFLAARPLSAVARTPCHAAGWRFVPAGVNAQIAFGVYARNAAGDGYAAHGLQLLSLDAEAQITDVMAFQQPAAFARFGLADTLDP
jgi:RNA polymerase sigma-70 factor (ECF subfamily)